MSYDLYQAINWEKVEEAREPRKTLPEGVLTLALISNDIKPGNNKSEDTHLNQWLTFKVLSKGDYEGIEHTFWYVLKNPNEVAERIGHQKMKELFLAIGNGKPITQCIPQAGLALKDISNKPFKAKITHEFNTYNDRQTGELRFGINPAFRYYCVSTEVEGENLPLVSSEETRKSQKYLDFVASKSGSSVAAAPQAARPPSAPPTAPSAPASAPKPAPVAPKAPAATTEEGSDAPEWLS